MNNDIFTIPHNREAEAMILGCILVDNSLIRRCELAIDDFHFPNHQMYYSLFLGFHEDREPIDLVLMSQVLGGEDLATLNEYVTQAITTSNFSHYENLVKELSIKRKLQRLGIDLARTVSDASVDELVTKTRTQISDIMAGRGADLVPMSQITKEIKTFVDRRRNHSGDLSGLSFGLKDLDEFTDGLQNGDMIVLAGRPGSGKSALSAHIAQVNALKNIPVGFISLEMGTHQLGIRSLSSLSQIEMWKLRKGVFGEMAYASVVDGLRKMAALPIWFCFSASDAKSIEKTITTMVQENGCKLIILDYLQLVMSSSGGAHSREREVAQVSNVMKNAARMNNIPVIALSQLNRAPEKEKRKPILADLRECLSVDDSWLFTPYGISRNVPAGMTVYSWALRQGVQESYSQYIPKTIAPCIKVRLRSGRYLVCTPSHPVLTAWGWKEAGKLTSDDTVGCVRIIPDPYRPEVVRHARWIGWMIGNGSYVNSSSPSFITPDRAIADAFCDQTHQLFGLKPRPHPHWSGTFQFDITGPARRGPSENACKEWLRLNLFWGQHSHEKRVPGHLLDGMNRASIAELIGGLFDTDGTVTESKGRMTLKYSTTSPALAWQLIWMLSRLGIFASLDDGVLNAKSNYPVYTVRISHSSEIERFRGAVTLTGKRQTILSAFRSRKPQQEISRLPKWVAKEVLKHARKCGISQSQLGYRDQGKGIGQILMREVLKRIGGSCFELDWLTDDSIVWVNVRSVSDAGSRELFDRCVPGHGCFVANGIIVHNSGAIEQDADVVMFLHNGEEEGTQEVIFAKGRNIGTSVHTITWKEETMTYLDYIRTTTGAE